METSYWHRKRPVLALVLILGGCFGSAPVVRHIYSLEPSGPIRARGQGPRISVGAFKVSPGYETDALAYRVTESELRHYVNRRWAAEPEQLVADALARHLRSTGLFAQVRLADEPATSGLLVSGRVVALEQVDHLQPDRWHARLALDLVVRDARDERVLFEQEFDVVRACRVNKPGEVVRVIREILSEQTARLAQRLIRAAPAEKRAPVPMAPASRPAQPASSAASSPAGK